MEKKTRRRNTKRDGGGEKLRLNRHNGKYADGFVLTDLGSRQNEKFAIHAI